MLCLKIRLNSIADIFKWEIRSSFWKSTVFYAGFKVLAMSILQEIDFFMLIENVLKKQNKNKTSTNCITTITQDFRDRRAQKKSSILLSRVKS